MNAVMVDCASYLAYTYCTQVMLGWYVYHTQQMGHGVVSKRSKIRLADVGNVLLYKRHSRIGL